MRQVDDSPDHIIDNAEEMWGLVDEIFNAKKVDGEPCSVANTFVALAVAKGRILAYVDDPEVRDHLLMVFEAAVQKEEQTEREDRKK